MDSKLLPKPIKRSYLRSVVGREYFTLKRRFGWLKNAKYFARRDDNTELDHSLIRHRSFILRPLRDVEMYLQNNKVTNLRLGKITRS